MGNRVRSGMMGLKPRCFPRAFVSALHVICIPTLTCLPSVLVCCYFAIFLCSEQLSCREKQKGWRMTILEDWVWRSR